MTQVGRNTGLIRMVAIMVDRDASLPRKSEESEGTGEGRQLHALLGLDIPQHESLSHINNIYNVVSFEAHCLLNLWSSWTFQKLSLFSSN